MRYQLFAAVIAMAPLIGMVGSVRAARGLRRPLGRPWYVLAASAGIGLLSVLQPATPGSNELEWLFTLLGAGSVALFALGLGWIIQLRDRQRFLEVALDAGMIVAIVALLMVRWSSGGQPVTDSATSTIIAVAAALAAPIAIGAALLGATVLLLARHGAPGRVTTSFIVAATSLGLSLTPGAFGLGGCCQPGDAATIAFALGWASLAVASFYSVQRGNPVFRSTGADTIGGNIRMGVAPVAALALVAIVADAGRAPLQQPTIIAVGALGILLAARVSQLLFATRTLSAQRTELHQSRALIELSHALSATTDLQETLDLVTQWAVRLLGGRGAAIQLLSSDGTTLEFRAIHGLPDDLLRLRLPVEGSFTGWVVQHAESRTTADPQRDPYITAAGLRYVGDSPIAAAPLRYRDETLGALSCLGRSAFDATDLELLGALADQAAVAIENARLFQQVHHLSVTDPLTSLPNRRQLERDLAREFAAAQRGRRLTVIMFDLNEFKQYNDRYGHLAGDEALRRFAGALAQETRAMNLTARYGGDEFLALLADAGRAEAEIVVSRVRDRFPGPSATPQEREISFAFGIAEFQPGMNVPEQLIAAADVALYEQKMGRAVTTEARVPQAV